MADHEVIKAEIDKMDVADLANNEQAPAASVGNPIALTPQLVRDVVEKLKENKPYRQIKKELKFAHPQKKSLSVGQIAAVDEYRKSKLAPKPQAEPEVIEK